MRKARGHRFESHLLHTRLNPRFNIFFDESLRHRLFYSAPKVQTFSPSYEVLV